MNPTETRSRTCCCWPASHRRPMRPSLCCSASLTTSRASASPPTVSAHRVAACLFPRTCTHSHVFSLLCAHKCSFTTAPRSPSHARRCSSPLLSPWCSSCWRVTESSRTAMCVESGYHNHNHNRNRSLTRALFSPPHADRVQLAR